ncbi:PEGA domain-containing protein [bacterium]|nr:PEGA domain-containing protein [bacterium]
MANSRRRKLFKIILHISGVLLFVFATSYALLAAYGYQVDLLHRNIVKTSIIDFSGDYPNVSIILNGEEAGNKLPYQIKNVRPGTYNIDIKSENFHNWKKTVEVAPDLVTRVSGIYLVPKHLEGLSKIGKFDFVYDKMISNGDDLFFLDNKNSLIYELNMGGEDEDRIKTITLPTTIVYKKVYNVGKKYLAFEDRHLINLLNLSSGEFIKIIIPDEFINFKLVYTSNLKGIYVNNGALFVVDISDAGVFNKIILIKNKLKIKEISIQADNDFIFIKLDDDLYTYKDGVLTLIASGVNSKIYISPLGDKILYQSNYGELYVYLFETEKNKLVARFAKEISWFDWLYDNEHIFILQNKNLLLCDMTMDNCPILKNDIFNKDVYVSQTKPLIMLIDKEGFLRINLALE